MRHFLTIEMSTKNGNYHIHCFLVIQIAFAEKLCHMPIVISLLFTFLNCKAYIPPRCKLPRVGHWAIPLTRDFRVEDINMLVSKKPGGPNAKLDRPNTKPGKPNVSL